MRRQITPADIVKGFLLFLTLVAALVVSAGTTFGQQPASTGQITASQINAVRAQYGLAPLAYDVNMEAWAAVNNQHQRAHGMGHYVVAPATRQNAAWNYADVGAVVQAWMLSPGHRDAILDRTVTTIGVAWDGVYWTMNAR